MIRADIRPGYHIQGGDSMVRDAFGVVVDDYAIYESKYAIEIITWEKDEFLGIVKYRYGDNDVIQARFKYFMMDVEFGELDEEFFTIEQYDEAVEKYGELEYDECFGYVPLLALGGNESVNNLKKVKMKEHIALIYNMVGEI